MTEKVSDAARLEGFSQAQVALTTVGAQSDQLDEGYYDVWCDEDDVFIKVAPTASDVTTETGYKIIQGNVVPIWVNSKRRIGGVLADGTGTLRFHKVGSQ